VQLQKISNKGYCYHLFKSGAVNVDMLFIKNMKTCHRLSAICLCLSVIVRYLKIRSKCPIYA